MVCSIANTGVIAKQLKKMSLENRRPLLGLEHERAEFIHTGIYALYTLLKLLGASDKFHVTTNGLRMGILKAYIKKTNVIQ